MGLFDKLKGKKETADWSNAYIATPNFYGKPDGTPFGAIALTEGTETVSFFPFNLSNNPMMMSPLQLLDLILATYPIFVEQFFLIRRMYRMDISGKNIMDDTVCPFALSYFTK